MTRRLLGPVVLTGSFVLALAAASIVGSSAAQDKGAAATPKAASSRTAQAASKAWPPHTIDGQPDISGVWGSEQTGIYSLNIEGLPHLRSQGMPAQRGRAQSAAGSPLAPGSQAALIAYAKGKSLVVDPPDGIIPYQPWALERRNSVLKEFIKPAPWQIDSQTRGWPNGIPRENIYSTVDGSIGGPIQILQSRGYVVFLYETHHEFRIVPVDGRAQPGKDIKLWEGSSRGHWEGNTLVIEVTNQNDSTRFDVVGDFHSDQVKVTERWTYADKDTLEYRATIEDPKVFTRPWTLAVTHKRAPAGTEIMEYSGVEGDTGVQTAEAIQRDKDAAAGKTK